MDGTEKVENEIAALHAPYSLDSDSENFIYPQRSSSFAAFPVHTSILQIVRENILRKHKGLGPGGQSQ